MPRSVLNAADSIQANGPSMTTATRISATYVAMRPISRRRKMVLRLARSPRPLPAELEDAARIDGASALGIFLRITLPLSRPALATLAAIQFTTWWTAFLWPLIVTTGKLDTLTINVALNTFRNANATQWGPIMAGSTLAVLPIIVVYLAAQRYFVEGIQLTGLGGR